MSDLVWPFIVIAASAMMLILGGVAFEAAQPIKRWTWWHTLGLVVAGSLYAAGMLGAISAEF